MKRFFLSLVLSLTVVAAEPSEKSISAIVEETLANNPELAFYQAQIAVARGETKSARARPNPEAEFEIGRKESRPKSGGLSDEGLAWAASLSQTFEWPNRLALRKAIANRQVELAEIGLAQFRRELAGAVKSAAFQLLVAQEKSAAAGSVAQRGEELINVLVQRETAGTSPLLESRIIEASILTLKHRANAAAKEAAAARLQLNQLRGQPIAAPLQIAPATLRFPSLDDADAFVALARTNNYEIKTKVIELQQQGLKVDLAKNERFPTFTIRPFYSQETAADREQTAGVGISAPLPLWNRNAGNIEAAKSRHAQAEASLAVTQRDIEKQVREQLARYVIDQKEIATWRSQLSAQLQEAAELADRHYRLGSVSVSTYLEMQEKYLEGAETILDTQAEALATLHKLERLTGAPLGNVIGSAEEKK